MMEDNDDAVFCGFGSFACLGNLQACLFSGLWSAILAKAQAHESQVALFFHLILFCDLNISKRLWLLGILLLLYWFNLPHLVCPLLYFCMCSMRNSRFHAHTRACFLLNMLFQMNISYFSYFVLLLLEWLIKRTWPEIRLPKQCALLPLQWFKPGFCFLEGA